MKICIVSSTGAEEAREEVEEMELTLPERMIVVVVRVVVEWRIFVAVLRISVWWVSCRRCKDDVRV